MYLLPKILTKTIAIALVSLTATLAILESSPEAIAQSPKNPTLIARRRKRLRVFHLGVRPLGRSISGYSRSAESCNKKQMNALVPEPQGAEELKNLKEFIAQHKITAQKVPMQDKTFSEHPMFFVYLSNLPPTQAEFILLDPEKPKETNQIYTSDIDKLPGGSGVIGIKLSSNSPALEVGKQYSWEFRVKCDPDKYSFDLNVAGSVRREAITGTKPDLDQLSEQGVWYDTLEELARNRYANPNSTDDNEDWESVMKAVGLPKTFQDAKIIKIIEL